MSMSHSVTAIEEDLFKNQLVMWWLHVLVKYSEEAHFLFKHTQLSLFCLWWYLLWMSTTSYHMKKMLMRCRGHMLESHYICFSTMHPLFISSCLWYEVSPYVGKALGNLHTVPYWCSFSQSIFERLQSKWRAQVSIDPEESRENTGAVEEKGETSVNKK